MINKTVREQHIIFLYLTDISKNLTHVSLISTNGAGAPVVCADIKIHKICVYSVFDTSLLLCNIR